jgi:Fuc2NAc and GlcNAc transferase
VSYWLLAGGVFACAVVLTGAWRAIAMRYALLDVPNRRSSHVVPTPRGAGAAIVLSFLPVLLTRAQQGGEDTRLALALAAGGLLVAAVGLVDDFRSVAPRWRLVAHVVAAALAVAIVGSPPELLGLADLSAWPAFVALLVILALVWHINLYNFMDGIDGIAGSQAVFVALAGGWLSSCAGHGWPPALLALAAASGGFLIWNWPRAKVFMGDVGSGFLGFALATLALHSAVRGELSVWTWLILVLAFVADATMTLVRRLLRGERLAEAHHNHAYQRWARRLGGHAPVTTALVLIDLAVLLPVAWASVIFRAHAGTIALCATAATLVAAWLLGSGRAGPEPPRRADHEESRVSGENV